MIACAGAIEPGNVLLNLNALAALVHYKGFSEQAEALKQRNPGKLA